MKTISHLRLVKGSPQLVLLTEQRTMKYLGSLQSRIPMADQIKGTMFEPHIPLEPELFPGNPEPKQ